MSSQRSWNRDSDHLTVWRQNQRSYDTENQKIFLKKLLKNVCKIKVKSIPKVKGQRTVVLIIKEFGRTCPPMNTVTDTSGKPKSRNLSVHWYDMSTHEKERQMGQFLQIQVQSSNSDSKVIEEAISLTDWITFNWKGSNKTRFQYCQNSCNKLLCLRAIQGHTGGEKIPPEMLGHAPIPHNWKEFAFHRGCSFKYIHIECWTHRRRTRRS